MTNEKVLEAINKQMNEELNSVYIYAAMAADFEAQNLTGFAAWMKVHAGEEMVHATKLYGYIYSRGGRATFKAIPEPKASYENPEEVFQKALEHEEYITSRVDDLVRLARQENDLATESLLKWYVDEQVEEEATIKGIIQKLKLAGQSPIGLYTLDKELGTPVPSSASSQPAA